MRFSVLDFVSGKCTSATMCVLSGMLTGRNYCTGEGGLVKRFSTKDDDGGSRDAVRAEKSMEPETARWCLCL
jgi:hypothetical protein